MLLLAALAACSRAVVSPDGGALVDSGGKDAGPSDAGPPDSGPDAGEAFDAGCASPLVFEVDAGCVFPPVLDLGDCPQYVGLACDLSFTPVAAGDSSTESITLFNNGDAPLHVSTVELVPPAPAAFTLVTGVSGPIAPHDYASVAVRFAPDDAGLFRARLHIANDSFNRPDAEVPIEGATFAIACEDAGDCLVTQICSGGTCSSCPSITPPPCNDGELLSTTDGAGCPQPTCRCPDGTIYGAGGRCLAAGRRPPG